MDGKQAIPNITHVQVHKTNLLLGLANVFTLSTVFLKLEYAYLPQPPQKKEKDET